MHLAQEDYEYWFEHGDEFIKFYEWGITQGMYNKCAFNLHQAAESFYSAILLVYTHYKPKLHDLEELAEKAAALNPTFLNAIPNITPTDQEHFQILRRAYIESRYKKDFSVSKEQLLRIAEMVKSLQEITERECLKKIGCNND